MAELAERMREILAANREPVRTLVEIVEAHFNFSRDDPDRGRFFFALWFGPQQSELMSEAKKTMRDLPNLLIEGVGRLAAANIIAPDRVGGCAKALRGMIVVATMDFLYRDRHPKCRDNEDEAACLGMIGPDLGPELAARLVGDLLNGFGYPGRRREDENQ